MVNTNSSSSSIASIGVTELYYGNLIDSTTIITDNTNYGPEVIWSTNPILRRRFKCSKGHVYETCNLWSPPFTIRGKCWMCLYEVLGDIKEIEVDG